MSLVINFFKTPDRKKQNIRFRKIKQLTGKEAGTIREAIGELMQTEFDIIYIDTTDTEYADLSGINEIIHTNYTLQSGHKHLVFAYRKQSMVEKWVQTTGLDKFVDTAILPAN